MLKLSKEEENKEKKKKLMSEAEKHQYRILTAQDIANAIDQLRITSDYILMTVDELEKSVRKLARKTKDSTSDILILLLFIAMMQRAQQSAQPKTERKSISIEDVQKILRECRKSMNPIECVENSLFGG